MALCSRRPLHPRSANHRAAVQKDDDARPDGFDTADALGAEIESLYGAPLPDGVRAYRIVFGLLPPQEQAAAVAERKKRKSAQKATAVADTVHE